MQRTLVLKRTLTPNKANRATFCPTGDWHIGAKTCDEDAINERLDFCLKKKIYLLGLGDYLEACLKDSKGDVFEQRYTPESQLERVVAMLQPIADAGLLLGLLSGNHERRISRATSIDITRMMAQVLKVPYLDTTCFAVFTVGKQKYTIHAQHGSSGARLPYTKIKAVLDLWRFNEAELVLMGWKWPI